MRTSESSYVQQPGNEAGKESTEGKCVGVGRLLALAGRGLFHLISQYSHLSIFTFRMEVLFILFWKLSVSTKGFILHMRELNFECHDCIDGSQSMVNTDVICI